MFIFKTALEYFGIPSPRRPEFGATVEAAFKPARTARAYTIALPLIWKLGIHKKYELACSFHISIGEDLGPEAKYIAIALRFFGIAEKKTQGGLAQWTRVMSKGLIHRNEASQPVADGETTPVIHTEIRVTKLQNSEEGKLLPNYEEFLPAMMWLAAALRAHNKQQKSLAVSSMEEQLAQIWNHYRNQVQALQSQYGVQILGEADWFEATGDPHDVELLQRLGIIKALQQYGLIKEDRRVTFEKETQRIFLYHAQQCQNRFNLVTPAEALIPAMLPEDESGSYRAIFQGSNAIETYIRDNAKVQNETLLKLIKGKIPTEDNEDEIAQAFVNAHQVKGEPKILIIKRGYGSTSYSIHKRKPTNNQLE